MIIVRTLYVMNQTVFLVPNGLSQKLVNFLVPLDSDYFSGLQAVYIWKIQEITIIHTLQDKLTKSHPFFDR